MKKALLVILVFSFLITSTELHEMFKIASLIEHYFEHKQSDENLSFTDFVALHYSNKNHIDGSENKLPFKNQHDFNFVSKLFKVNITKHLYSYTINLKYLKKSYIINNDNKNTFRYIHTIWQPPKF